ncbi:MAG: hypothetical protein NTX03_05735, partial [Bacteroidetes bacterium]|nr:hypothetical protein [Bacteroidota bacterium]
MSKKVQFILIPILLLSLAGGIIYYFFNKPEGDYPNAVYALPDNSIAVWQGKDVQHTSTTFTESGIFKYFLQNAEVADFNANISYFDSIFNKVDELKEALKVSSLLVSAHLTGNEKCGLLFLLQIQNKLDKTSFTKIIKRIEPGYSFTERNFEGYILYDIKNENKESMFCVAFIKGIFAISASPILVEDAIAAYKYHGRKLPDLHEEIKNATTKDKVFLNYKYVSNFIASHLSADYQKEVTALGNNLSFGEYDYKTDESNISLSGTIPASTSSKNYLDIFIGMKPAKMEILDVIPSKSFALICNEVSSLDAFLKRYNEIAPNTETRNADLKNLETKYATTFPELTKWIGNEWGYSMLESKENSRDSLEEILFVKSADTNNIVDALRQLNTKT